MNDGLRKGPRRNDTTGNKFQGPQYKTKADHGRKNYFHDPGPAGFLFRRHPGCFTVGMTDGLARLGKVIDHAIDKFRAIILETRKGYNQTVFLYNTSGDDSVPCKNDKVIILKIDGTGNFIGAGVLIESQGAKPGEKIFFGRDADGKVVSKLSMLNSGDIKAEADKDILFSSKENQEYKADKNFTAEAQETATVKGKDTNLEAQVKATLNGADVEVKMIWKNCAAVFTYLSLGALRGLSPAERGGTQRSASQGRDFSPFKYLTS
jgi:hypothetical protein